MDVLVEQRDFLGMTLGEYARAIGTHPQAARPRYSEMMRQSVGVELPEVTRREEADGLVKFCLPVGEGKRNTENGKPERVLESESVIIPMESYRGTNWYTLCVSSQVGCRMGCTFCETGRMGLLRDLTAGEIVRQRMVARVIRMEDGLENGKQPTVDGPLREHAQRGEGDLDESEPALRPAGHGTRNVDSRKVGFRYFWDGIQNIVFMGMGEPLDNFENVVQAVRVLNDPAGLDFPHTQITVSTVGRIDGLRKLAALKWINLRVAISLNAANDRLRDELMPINKGMPLADLQRTLLEYPLAKKGRFLIEYVLIKGVNDSPADADAVAAWCTPLPCIVNVSPYNPQRFARFETPGEEAIGAFIFRLKGQGIFVKRRITHGRDLMGACGQLGNPEVRRRRETRSHEDTKDHEEKTRMRN